MESDAGKPKKPTVPSDGSEPPAVAIAVVVGSIFIALGSANWLGDFVPSAYRTYFYVSLIFFPMVAMIVAMIAVKGIDLKRSANWPTATGRVVKSAVGQGEIGVEDRKLVNVPVVEYEFQARGRKWRGARIGIGDAMAMDIEATLKKYPAGASVTVHYDPRNPADCLLERDGPSLPTQGCLKDSLKLAAVAAFIIYMFNGGYQRFEASIPNPGNAGVVLFAACFGVLALMFFYAQRVIAKRASNWPSVQGLIVSSAVVRSEKRTDGRLEVWYSPSVEFSYPVNGVEYRSRQIKLNLNVSGTESYAKKVCARYPEGAEVDVHYDPANPGTAALENPVGYGWLLLLVALGCFALAIYLAAFAR